VRETIAWSSSTYLTTVQLQKTAAVPHTTELMAPIKIQYNTNDKEAETNHQRAAIFRKQRHTAMTSAAAALPSISR
jgi:hypothetical protein